MREIKKYILSVLLVLLVSNEIISQYRFTNYNFTHGLPITDVNQFAEDSLGNLWIGSNNGLVKFDGLEFIYFEPRPDDPTSIKGSEIADIQVDAAGQVWVTFHSGGLSIYDHKTEQFRSRVHGDNDDEEFPRSAILYMYIDNESQYIWASASREGFYKIDMNSLQGEKVISFERNYDIVEDPSDKDYFFIGGNKLRRLNKSSYDFEEISDKTVHKIFLEDGIIYGHDWSGRVFSYDPLNKVEHSYITKNDYVNRGLIKKDDELWLVNYGGIHPFSLKSGEGYSLDLPSRNSNEIESHHVFGIFKDNSERVWIGTDEGLSVIIPEYQVLKNVSAARDVSFSDIVPGFEKDKYYASSIYDFNLELIDIENNTSSPIVYRGNEGLIGPNQMIKSEDRIWVLAHNLLGYILKEESELRKFDGGEFNDLIHKEGLGDILEDSYGNVWLSKHDENFLLKISQDYQTVDTTVFSELKEGQHMKVTLLDGDVIWVGTAIGLCRFNIVTGEKKWFYTSSDPYSIFTSNIEHLGSDSEGNLWVLALDGGAWKCHYNNDTDSLEIIRGYFQVDGLANNRPWHIEMDSEGTLYFGSNSGLSIYNASTDRMVSYGKEYGFKYLPLHTKIYDDKVFILSRGLSYFDIHDWDTPSPPPKVNIRSIISTNDKVEGEIRKFSYDRNDISIDFASTHLSRARDITYKYRIKSDDAWSYSSYSNRIANYNSLPPGEYTFEVAAAYKDMIWGPVDSFQFTINPPYWKTWWFRALVILLSGIFIYGFIKWRERQIKRIAGMQARMTELENEALRAQMNPHFIFNSLNSIKSFIITNRKEEAADYLTTFAELIRTILRNSKNQLIPLSEEIKALDLYMEIENIRLNEKFDYEWKIDPKINSESYLIPPLAIQPFVENAIWHGFVHKEGKGHLLIDVIKNSDHLLFEITDNGVGREKSRMIEQKHFRKRSYGIAITKQRLGMKEDEKIEIIDLKDEQGRPIGTKVIVKIPIHTIN